MAGTVAKPYAEKSGVRMPAEARNISSSSRRVLGPTQPPI